MVESLDPGNNNVVDSKWVFKRKVNSDGTERFKARLVARGFSQTKGINYDEVFSPVIRYETIRYIIANSINPNTVLTHLDVETAFLNGDLQEEIYMKLPAGCEQNSGKIVKLNRSIYGLKQASRNWHKKFTDFLKDQKFSISQADPCLFYKKIGDTQIILGLYVDDILISGPRKESDILAKVLASRFKMRNLGVLKNIVGMEVEREGSSISIHQESFIRKLLDKFGMSDAKSVPTPVLSVSVPDSESDCTPFADVSLFAQAVGSLNYLVCCTRPDIAFAVYEVAKKMRNPNASDWTKVKRIFRYLKGTSATRLVFKVCEGQRFCGFSDASYAMNADRKSTSGFVFVLNNGAISWKTKKQNVVAMSSMESEFIALCEAAKEALFLRKLLTESSGISPPVLIYEDNQSAIALAKSESLHQRSKHMDIRFNFLKDLVQNDQILIKFMPTEEMTADILTKGLSATAPQRHCAGLGLTMG